MTPVPSVPYWIPVIGNLPQVLMGMAAFLRRLRDTSTEGIIRLQLMNTTHYMILDPLIATKIFSQRSSVFDTKAITQFFLNVVGGVPAKYAHLVTTNVHELETAFGILMREPYLGNMMRVVCRNLEIMTPQLVANADRPIDQYAWELRADVHLVSSESDKGAVEASLL